MAFEEFAKSAVEGLGGRKNFRHVTKCTRSIRVDYLRKADIQKDILDKLTDCAGYADKNHQVQLIIGIHVSEAYDTFLKEADWDPENEPVIAEINDESEVKHDFKYYVNKFGDVASKVFMPVIPAMIVGGLILAVRNLLVNYFGVSMTSGAAYLMTAIFEAGFSALPIYLGYSVCAQLKMKPIMGLLLGALLVGPTYTGGKITDLFGIPIPQVSYYSSIMPVIFGCIFMYYCEKLVTKIIPQMLRFFLVPLLTMIITVPVTLIVLGPIGNMLSGYVATGVLWINNTFGFIAQPILCMVYPYMVMLGLDKALSPIGIQLIAEVGYNPVTSIMGFVSNLCVGASTLAVASKTEDKEKKGMLSSFGVTGLCGVTEPAFYGCLISNEPARIGTMVGAACAGLFAGIFGLRTYVQGGCPGLLTFIFFIDNNGGFYYVMIAAITAVIAISVSYLFTCIRISYSHKKENRAEEKL